MHGAEMCHTMKGPRLLYNGTGNNNTSSVGKRGLTSRYYVNNLCRWQTLPLAAEAYMSHGHASNSDLAA